MDRHSVDRDSLAREKAASKHERESTHADRRRVKAGVLKREHSHVITPKDGTHLPYIGRERARKVLARLAPQRGIVTV